MAIVRYIKYALEDMKTDKALRPEIFLLYK